MLITQISDSHIDVPAQSERAADLVRCVDYINGLDRQPQLVVHCGDIVHNGRPEEYAAAAKMLSGLRAPFAVMVGNRDERTALRAEFADLLPANCHPHYIQYAIDTDDMRLIMLDTVSDESKFGRLCSQRLGHFADLLAQAGSKPVVVFMHHPTFEIVASPCPFEFESREDAAAFAAIIEKHPNVRSIHAGHCHREARGEVAGVLATTVPSIASDLCWEPACQLPQIAAMVPEVQFEDCA